MVTANCRRLSSTVCRVVAAKRAPTGWRGSIPIVTGTSRRTSLGRPARKWLRVKVAGTLVTAKSATVRRTGESMKFITLEDETDLCEVTLFPRVYAKYGARLLSRGPYLVTGTVEDDHGSVTLTADTLAII